MTFILDDYKKMRTSYENQRAHKYDSKLTGALFINIGRGTIVKRRTYYRSFTKSFD